MGTSSCSFAFKSFFLLKSFLILPFLYENGSVCLFPSVTWNALKTVHALQYCSKMERPKRKRQWRTEWWKVSTRHTQLDYFIPLKCILVVNENINKTLHNKQGAGSQAFYKHELLFITCTRIIAPSVSCGWKSHLRDKIKQGLKMKHKKQIWCNLTQIMAEHMEWIPIYIRIWTSNPVH